MSLRDAIHSEIAQGKYECIICYEPIRRSTPIWSCSACYRCFDLKCAKTWWKRETDGQRETKCPFCRSHVSKATVQRASYRCWCRKESAPSKKNTRGANAGWDKAIPPHSCGQTCGAKRKCPHPCPLVCHAGPHLDSADCTYLGPKIKCFCGKHSEKVICSQTRYNGYSCGEQCGKKNPVCGHRCTQRCHEHPNTKNGGRASECGSCEVSVKLLCFCGRSKARTATCESVPVEQRRRIKATRNKTTVSCGRKCETPLSCGIHTCELPCHPKSPASSDHACPFLPYEGESCFCGKTEAHRSLCTDAVPSCGSVCGKKLACGHSCESTCHAGDCPPCTKTLSDVKCRCGNTSFEATCGEASRSALVCDKKCGAVLSCGRHHCANICCDYSPKRLRDIQHSTHDTPDLDSLTDRHNTTGRHSTGPRGQTARSQPSRSQPSRNQNGRGPRRNNGSADAALGGASDYELALFISGAEAAHACSKTCDRQLSCGTHACQETCHAGKCPPCMATSFDEWACPCGRTRLEPPIRCGTELPSCSYPCHRPQPCGHRATHECHDDTTQCASCSEVVLKPCRCGKNSVRVRCDQAEVVCKEQCGNTLECGHKCLKICCPGGSSCPPCTSICDKTLKCGHKDASRCHFPTDCRDCRSLLQARCPCGALRLYYECGEDVEISCNYDCLMEAYSPVLQEAYAEERGWICGLELQVRQFVKQSDKKSLWLQPMGVRHRRLAHLLMEHYGISSESMDYGKNRSVCGHKTKDTWLCRRWLKDAPRKSPELRVQYIDLGSWRANKAETPSSEPTPSTEAEAVDTESGDADIAAEEPGLEPSTEKIESEDGMILVKSRSGGAHSPAAGSTESQSELRNQKFSFSLLA